MNPIATTLAVSLAASLGLLAPLGAQDSIQLKDGRFVVDKKMTRTVKGITVHFDNGDIFVPNEKILSTTAVDASGSAAMSAADKERLAKGLVLHNGRWVRAEERERDLVKLREKRAAMIVEAKKRQNWVNRHIVKTQNFQFEFTLDPGRMQNYMDLMETYYKVFTKEWGIRKPSNLKQLKVCFYHDQETFNQVGGVGGGVIGYFRFVQPIELNFFYERMDEELTVDVMFHEANHYLTYLIDPNFRYPAWVNESLAEYYGASEWDPETKRMKLGGIQEGRLAVIQDAIGANSVSKKTVSPSEAEDRWLDLEEMIRIPRFAAVHYAWGWSFVHFLLSDKRYEKRFKKFYVDLARSSAIKKTAGSYFGRTVDADEQIKWLLKYLKAKSLDDLEKEWYQHILSLKPASARGYHAAGRFAYSRNMPIKAQRLLQIAIDMKSTNPMTWVYLGKAQMDKDKFQEAAESFDKAIAMDPLHGMFYIMKARCIERGGDKEAAKKLRKLALEVDPDNDSVVMAAAIDDTE